MERVNSAAAQMAEVESSWEGQFFAGSTNFTRAGQLSVCRTLAPGGLKRPVQFRPAVRYHRATSRRGMHPPEWDAKGRRSLSRRFAREVVAMKRTLLWVAVAALSWFFFSGRRRLAAHARNDGHLACRSGPVAGAAGCSGIRRPPGCVAPSKRSGQSYIARSRKRQWPPPAAKYPAARSTS